MEVKRSYQLGDKARRWGGRLRPLVAFRRGTFGILLALTLLFSIAGCDLETSSGNAPAPRPGMTEEEKNFQREIACLEGGGRWLGTRCAQQRKSMEQACLEGGGRWRGIDGCFH